MNGQESISEQNFRRLLTEADRLEKPPIERT